MRIKTISIIIIIMSLSMLSFAQMDMKTMDMKKDTVPASQKKKVTKKIGITKQ